MKLTQKLALWILVPLVGTASVQAEYKETMGPNGPTRNLQSDYGLTDDNARADQSETFQKAIDDLAAKGGGRLIVPKGTYRLAGVRLRSNIHLLFEKDTVIKPYWPEGTKAVVFLLDAERPANKRKMTPEQEKTFIENVSIRGLGGRWIVDYADRESRKGEGIRAVLATMVRNFLIADLDVKDNFTTYCGITLTPLQTKSETKDWPVSRATDGTVRNCRIYNASPGYGLTQLHGAQSVHFEDIYARGGVTLRLETGAVGLRTGVFDITAKNVVNENGRCAVMFGPHSAVNGVVKIDGVLSKSSTYTVSMGKGGVKEAQLRIEPDATDGSFAEGSYVRNIHAVFGRHAQVKTHAMLAIPEEYYDELSLRWFDKFFEGPSIGAVKDSTQGHYHIRIENVTMEGFKYNADKPILTDADERPGKWGVELRHWKASRPTETKVRIPRIASDYVNVYQGAGDVFPGPDAAELIAGRFYDNWVPNDHCFVRDESGCWHAFGITHPLTDVSNVHAGEHLLFHTIAPSGTLKETLREGSWKDQPKILPPRERPAEIPAIHAPWILRRNGLFHMVYGPTPIRYAESKDLSDWTPKGSLRGAPSGRDPQVFVWNDIYHLVVCGVHDVRVATSRDFQTWTQHGPILKMKAGVDPESPSVVRYNDTFYLFVCGWNGVWDRKDIQGAYQHKTYVYQSDDLLKFELDREVAVLDAHAPEIFQDEAGDWFISSVEWPHRGVSIARLVWE